MCLGLPPKIAIFQISSIINSYYLIMPNHRVKDINIIKENEFIDHNSKSHTKYETNITNEQIIHKGGCGDDIYNSV